MTTILHKRGTGKPSPDDLKVGEIAIDTLTGTLYTKQSDGSVVEIGGDPDLSDYVTTSVEKAPYAQYFYGDNQHLEWGSGGNGGYHLSVGNGIGAGGDGLGFAAIYCEAHGGGVVELNHYGLLVNDTNLSGKLNANIVGFQNIKTQKDGSIEAGLSFEFIGANPDGGGWKANVLSGSWDDFDGDGDFDGLVRIEGSPTGFTNSLNKKVGTIIDGWGRIDTSKDITARGTVQAKDYLDADGNSIIGAGGGGDPEWAYVGKAESDGGTEAVWLGYQSRNPWIINQSVAIGYDGNCGNYGVSVGWKSSASTFGAAYGASAKTTENSVAIGANAQALQTASIALGSSAETTKPYEFAIAPSIKEVNFTNAVVQATDYLDANGNSIIGSGGGGGGDVDLTGYATETWVSANYQVKGNYLTSNSLNGYATQTWVGQNYQPKGNYLTSFTESDPTVPSWVKSISQNDINKWNNPPSGGSYTQGNGISIANNTISMSGQYASNSPFLFDYSGNNTSLHIASTNSRGAEIWLNSGSNDANKYMRANPNGNWEVVNGPYSAVLFAINNTGDLTATGDVMAYSDERLKDNIETLDGSKVYEMRGVSYTKDGREGSGVIAQELQKVAPELVSDEGEYLTVAYGNLVGYLIEAVKDLKAEVEELKRGL